MENIPFVRGNDSLWIDLPHELMEKLLERAEAEQLFVNPYDAFYGCVENLKFGAEVASYFGARLADCSMGILRRRSRLLRRGLLIRRHVGCGGRRWSGRGGAVLDRPDVSPVVVGAGELAGLSLASHSRSAVTLQSIISGFYSTKP